MWYPLEWTSGQSLTRKTDLKPMPFCPKIPDRISVKPWVVKSLILLKTAHAQTDFVPANTVFDIDGIIKPNGITRKLSGVENWLVCVAGVWKGGKRERRAREAREDRTRSFWLSSLSTASHGGYKLKQVSDHLVPFLEFIYRWLTLSFAKDRTFIIKVFRARSVLALSQIPAPSLTCFTSLFFESREMQAHTLCIKSWDNSLLERRLPLLRL